MSERTIRRVELCTTILACLGGLAAWGNSYFAHADIVSIQNEDIKQIRTELHQLYMHMIPEPERLPARSD